MSFVGENYFHSDDPATLNLLLGVIQNAVQNGQGVRIFTNSGGLQIARGGSCWSGTLYSTPDGKRDTTTQPIYVRS